MLLAWHDAAPVASTLVVVALSAVILVCHELGHVAAVLCCNARCLEYKIGCGPGIRICTIRGCAIRLGILPVGGRVKYATRDVGPLGRAVIAAGGPITTGAMGVAIFMATRGEPETLPLWFFLAGCVCDCAFSISPLWSDGRAVIANLFRAAGQMIRRST
jgi:hypothetical protein